jgi:hypothetical protein
LFRWGLSARFVGSKRFHERAELSAKIERLLFEGQPDDQ